MNTCIRVFADSDQINRCREDLKSKEEGFLELADVLNLAGNAVRLKILYLLKQENELCPCDLSDILGMTVPAISQHLKKLKDAGIVTTKKSGQTIFYSVEAHSQRIISSVLDLFNLPNTIPAL
ncbi:MULTISPECIES: ArsR/SmtB family transcription factor [Cyclobacteriaceae]|uniref:DNA-binding transcriptional ArsR family regulator n=3 Tax=Cyclobacteriaceae TaxID=563798 RepID=A0A841MS06_9BACT|nr:MULTISPECIES: metalloregulator ArsR/SmtB family transcription factor [Cyclobacteriaceae]MBB6325398.1 DNA-binding transcriptional ArsR family regulator [Algoriphagus iocasae]MBR9776465.1 winged helix-turn-helix transcriptional regulator [Cytophagales bacterium]